MIFTWSKPSKRFQISKKDIKRIAITVWLIAIPVFSYIVSQLQYNEPINWSVAIGAWLATIISMIEQFLRNNQNDTWPITII